MIRCVSSNLNAHLVRVGEYLRKSRASYDQRFVDVEIICGNQKDYVHSLVANIHSSFVREAMNNISPPFRIILNGYRAQSLSRIIDWMYSGEIEIDIKHLVDYLAITAALGIEELHNELQSYLLKLATKHSYLRVPCINIAFQPHYKVSANVRLQLLLIIAREHYALSKDDLHQLSAASLSALLKSDEMAFNDKIDIINIALLWLKDERHKASIDEVLSSIRIQNLSEAERQTLIDHLKRRFADTDHDSRKTLHVYSDDQRRVVVSGDPQKYIRSSAVIVPSSAKSKALSNKCESLQSADSTQKLHLSDIHEFAKLPDINSSSNTTPCTKLNQQFMPQSDDLSEGRLSTSTPTESITPSHYSTAVSTPMSGRSFNQYSSSIDEDLLQMGFKQQLSSYPYQLNAGHRGQSVAGISEGGLNHYGSYGSTGQLFAGVPQQQHGQFKGRVSVGPSNSLSHTQQSPIFTAREFSPVEGQKGSNTSRSQQHSLRNLPIPTASFNTAKMPTFANTAISSASQRSKTGSKHTAEERSIKYNDIPSVGSSNSKEMKRISQRRNSRSVAASRENTGSNIATFKQHLPVSWSRNIIPEKHRSTDPSMICATARSVRSPMIETARASTPSSGSEQGSTTSSNAASSTKTARSSHPKMGNASEAHILREIIVKTKRKKK